MGGFEAGRLRGGGDLSHSVGVISEPAPRHRSGRFGLAGSSAENRDGAFRALRIATLLVICALQASCSTTSSPARRSAKPAPSLARYREHLAASGAPAPASDPPTATGTCRASALSYSLHANAPAGFASTPGAVIGVTMTPGVPCSVSGFPGVSFTTAAGAPLLLSDTHEAYQGVSSAGPSMVQATPRAPAGFWVSYLDEPSAGTACSEALKMTVSFASGASGTAQFPSPVKVCGSSVAVSSVFAAIYPPPAPPVPGG